ncbi:MAG: hypothetical protein K0S64_643 [Gaiellaceae bacterium]|nr:hypothetical protein [Gaiellaceae bacterium]
MGGWISELPTEFFMVVHIAGFAIGSTFAWAAFKRELTLLGLGFSLDAAAEVVHMTLRSQDMDGEVVVR